MRYLVPGALLVAVLVVCGFMLKYVGSAQAGSKTEIVDTEVLYKQKKPEDKKMQEVAIIKTRLGEIVVRFFPEVAPKHVASFIKLAKEGFFNGTIFHRVIPGFMIQGGDPNTKDPDAKGTYGTGGPGYSIDAEFSDKKHERGILSAARSQNPNSAGSQFFLMVAPSPHLDGQYSIFGEVIEGMDVADKIVNEKRDGRDLPLERVEMTITIEERKV